MVVHWVNIVVCGYRNFTVNACDKIPGGNLGDCTHDTGIVRVRFAETTYMQDTLLHEVTHAVWDASGLKALLRSKWGKVLSDTQLVELEEDVIVGQTPGLLATLNQAGWLTLPLPPPKE